MNLNSVLIGTEDPKPLVEYYTKLFGEPAGTDRDFAWWQLGTGGFTVGFHDQIHGRNVQPGRVIWNIESSDVKSDFDRLVAAGARVIREPYAPSEDATGATGMLVCTFADPDDNYFQLVSPM